MLLEYLLMACTLLVSKDRFSEANPLPTSGHGLNITCVGPSICRNVSTGQRFTCLDATPHECCQEKDNTVKLYKAPRGTLCCHGDGMYDIQTHDCVNGIRRVRATTQPCPHSFKVIYNTATQVCCGRDKGEPSVHLAQEGNICCGAEYIQNTTSGCCGGFSFEKRTHSCVDGSVRRKEVKRPSRRKSVQKDCSGIQLQKEFKGQKKAFFVYAFITGKYLGTKDGKKRMYEVEEAKQFVGKQKLKPAEAKLKKLIMPRRGCPGRLKHGATYVVISKSKATGTTLVLHPKKYAILPEESSNVFARMFGL